MIANYFFKQRAQDQMINKSNMFRPIWATLLVLFFILPITGCYKKEKLFGQVPLSDQREKAGNISDKDRKNFLSSVRKIDANIEANYRLALHLQKRNRHKNAIEVLKEIIQADPTYVKAYNAMGVSFDHLGDYNRAIHSYKLAVAINPELDYVYNNLGYSHLLYGNYDLAIDAFHKAISLNEQNKRYHNNLGLAYTKKGQFDLAFEQFKLAGDEISANHKLAKLLYREGKYDLARKYRKNAIQLEASADKTASAPIFSKEKISDTSSRLEEKYPKPELEAVILDSDQIPLEDEKGPVSEYSPSSRSQKKYKELAEVEVLNGNGIEGMAKRLGNYLKKKGFNVTRLGNANSFNHIESKIFYGSGQAEDARRIIEEVPVHPNMKNIIELKDLDNKIRLLIGKDIVPHNDVISRSFKTVSLHSYSILLSSCRRWDSVQKVLTDYRKIGLAPYVVRVELGKNELWWRIFTGHYKNRQEALKIKNRHDLSDSIILKTPYTNLIDSFSSEMEAKKMLHNLKKLGYSPYIVKTDEHNFRLVVGAFETKKGAKKQKLELESNDLQNQIIER
jgi:Flp pilus assembly protein TadD